MSTLDRIRVVVRVRPRESSSSPSVWKYDKSHVTSSRPNASSAPSTFTYDTVFGETASNYDIYSSFAQPIAFSVLAGINATLFAYGQTATGKTHTMTGTSVSPGLIPQIVNDIFSEIKQTDHPERFFPNCPDLDSVINVEFCMRVSYVEIYNESVNDLLNPSSKNLQLRETSDGRVDLECEELIVKTPAQVMEILRRGEANRHIGATNMNERSSRSHTVFRLTLESTLSTEEAQSLGGIAADEPMKLAHVAVLTVVDLAGSERIAHTGAEGARRVEAGQINKSLLTLGTVINKLSEGKGGHVPYRDSKLTRLLQPSLGGNARTGIICTISLAPAHYEETLSTLKFASRAKRVENTPVINEVQDAATVLNDLKMQIRLLKQQLAERRSEQSEKELATLSQSIIATPSRRRQPRNVFGQAATSKPEEQPAESDKKITAQQKDYEIKLKKMQQLLDYANTRAEDAESVVKEKEAEIDEMQREMFEMKREMSEVVMQYEERIAKLTAQLEGMLTNPQRQQRSSIDENQYTKHINELEEQISDLSDKLEESSQKVEILQAELDQVEFARQNTERQFLDLQGQCEIALDDNDAKAQTITELEERIRELMTQLSREPPAKRPSLSSEALVRLRQQLESITNERDALSRSLESMKQEAEETRRTAENNAISAQMEVQQKEATIQSILQKQNSLKEEQETLKAKWDEQRATLSKELREKDLKIAELVGKLQQSQSSVESAQATLRERDALCKTLQDSLTQMEEQARVSSIESEKHAFAMNARLEDAEDAQRRIEQDLAEAREMLKERDAQCNALENTVSTLSKISHVAEDNKSLIERINSLESEVIQLQSSTKELEESKKALTSQLNTVQMAKYELEQSFNGKLEKAKEDIKKEVEETVNDFQERIHDLETQRDDLMEENNQLRESKASELTALNEEITKLKQQRDSEHRRWRAERIQANNELQGVKNYVTALEEQISSLESSHSSS